MRKTGEEVMTQQKKETREGLDEGTTILDTLKRVYGMEAVDLMPLDLQAFRNKTRRVYTKWAEEIGIDLVRIAEKAADTTK